MPHQDIINLINEGRTFEAFEALDDLGIKSPIYAQLKLEFQSGRYDFNFYERLKVFVNGLKNNALGGNSNAVNGGGNITIQGINDNKEKIEINVGQKEKEELPKKKILFLAACPKDTAALDFPKEFETLKKELRAGSNRDDYEWLMPVFAASLEEMMHGLNQKPQLVHFSGHGERGGIVLETAAGYSELVANNVLERLFKKQKDNLELIVLNSCYSAEQAKQLSQHGFYVAGYNRPIGDDTAICFAKGLYLALGDGETIIDAMGNALTLVMARYPQSSFLVEVWKNGEMVEI